MTTNETTKNKSDNRTVTFDINLKLYSKFKSSCVKREMKIKEAFAYMISQFIIETEKLENSLDTENKK